MGYYTDFIISFDTSVVDKNEVYDYIKEISNQQFDDNGLLYSRWHKHVDDMKNVSVKFSDILFTLEGQGDCHGDLWFKYFKNGKVQSCYAGLVYPEFNENLME